MHLHHILDAGEDPERRRPFATAIGMQQHIIRQKSAQLSQLAVARGGEESLGDFVAMFRRHRETRPPGTHMGAGPAGQLPARGLIAADGLGDLVEFHPEHVMQQERRALQRRQPLQRHHQRQGDIVHLVRFGGEHRLGQPGPDIDFALLPRRFQHIQTKPCDHLAQPRFRLAHRGAVGVEPAQECLLHHILGVRDRAQHAIGDAGQPRTQGIEGGRSIVCGLAAHQAAFFCKMAGLTRKPTPMRLKPLITTIIIVRLICSSGLKASAIIW